MKKQYLSFVFFCTLTTAFGQFCAYATANQTVQTNGSRSTLAVGGFLQDYSNYNSAFTPFYKNAESPSTIFSSTLWFIGKSGATQKLVANTYQNFSFAGGPINDVTRQANPANCRNWDKFWTVQRFEIEAHQRDFADNGRIDNPIPNIMAWPAVGNPNSLTINGFALPARISGRSYAPFKDVNADGVYNPMQGDYPAIAANSNLSPDIITWSVVNDLGLRTPLNLEIQATAYAYECNDTAQVLNNSLFTSYKIIHHGATDLDSFKIGLFADFDLGCYTDDCVGCDSTTNTLFVYNRNPNIDGTVGNVCDQGINTFKSGIPVQAITFMNQTMSRHVVFYNAITGAPSATVEPQSVADYVNLFNGKWRDGKPVTRGGTGYNATGTEAKFMFPSDPFDSSATAWSMARVPNTSTYDTRSVGIVEFDKMLAGESKTVDLLYSAHRKTGRNAWQNLATMREDLVQLKSFYQNPTAAALCGRVVVCDGADCVWAGDANRDGIANYKDLLPIGVAQAQTGAPRNGNIVWSPRTATNWANTYADGNFNVKHIDCDGNGKVELLDFGVTKNNLQLKKPDFQRPNDVYTEGSDIVMQFNRNVDSLTYSIQNDYDFVASASIKTTTDLYGLAFEIEYDPFFLKIVTPYPSNNPASGTELVRLIDSSKTSSTKAQVEFSRLSFFFQGTANEPLFQFKLGLNLSSFLVPTNTTYLRFKNIKGVKRDGTIIPLGGKTQRVRIMDIIISGNDDINAARIAIYPNPTTDETTVNWGKTAVKNLRLTNAIGQMVLNKPIATGADSDVLNLRFLPSGVYFLHIQSVDNKAVVRKIVVSR
jgi:hypothetical protein